MASLRYIVAPALAMAAGVAAQSGACAGTTTIQNSADATALAACQTYDGDIAIATGIAGNIALDGLRSISGSLIANNVTGLSALSGSDLEEIGDEFDLESLTILSTLNFPSLVKVKAITWQALPALQGLSFTQGVQEVDSLMIDNTQLSSLDGINLQVADEIVITNNPYLQSVNMQLGNVTRQMTLSANGNKLQAEFPNLIWANNITLRNVSDVSIPSLASINGSLGFYSNGFDSLAAPNLTNVGGSLSFVSCDAVTNISLPELTQVGGGFQVANNTKLEKINGVPKLKTVGGALDFNGEFNEVDLPALEDVRGAFNLQSTQNIDDACSHFSGLSGNNNVIKGTYTCKGEESSPGGAGTLPDGTNSGSGSSTSSGAASPMLIPGATGVLGVVAAIFGLL